MNHKAEPRSSLGAWTQRGLEKRHEKCTERETSQYFNLPCIITMKAVFSVWVFNSSLGSNPVLSDQFLVKSLHMTHWGHVRSPFWKQIIIAALKLVREIKTCKRSPDEVSWQLSTGSWSKQRPSQSECLDANQDQTRVLALSPRKAMAASMAKQNSTLHYYSHLNVNRANIQITPAEM